MQAPFADPLPRLERLYTPLPLVGRESELQLIRLLLDTVALDLPTGARAMTISGEMGIGKSRLLAEMYAEARAKGFRIIEGHAYEAGRTFPYLPFIEALRPVFRSATSEQLRSYVGLASLPQYQSEKAHAIVSLTGTPLVASLARLFPDLPAMLDVAIEPEILSPDQEKFRLLDAIATVLERMAMEQPILLGIDNLQWADSASLELMIYLTIRLHRRRVALVGGTRPISSSSALEQDNATIMMAKALGDLMRQGILLVLPLSPLHEEAAMQHIHALLPGSLPSIIIQEILHRAGGNPFFLEELVRMLTLNGQLVLHNGTNDAWQANHINSTALPDSIVLAVEERLHRLSAACRNLLRIGSLFGRIFPLEALIAVLDDTEEHVQTLLNEAVQAGLIALQQSDNAQLDEQNGIEVIFSSHRSSTCIFCQGIVHEIVSAEFPRSQRGLLHGRIAEALTASYGADAPAHAAELAHHYALSEKKSKALYWSLRAGEDAAHQQAHREAIHHFRFALSLLETEKRSAEVPPSAHLYLAIGNSWFKLGELEQAGRAFQQALEQRESEESKESRAIDPLRLAQANRQLADVYRLQGKYDLALAHLQAAQSALAHEQDSMPSEEQSITIPWFAGRIFSTVEKSSLQARSSVRERILLLQAQATLDILLFREPEAEANLWQSYQLAIEAGDKGSQAFALHMVGWLRGWGERIHEAIRLQKQAHDLYISTGDPFRAVLGDQGLGIIYQALGEMEQARLHTLRGFERARLYGVVRILGWLHWNSGVMALAQGRWENSDTHLQQAMQEAENRGDARLKPVVLQAQAELAFRRGDWKSAERAFQASISTAINTEWYPGTMALYGHFLAVTGRRVEARSWLDRAATYPESPGYGGDFYMPFLAEGYLHINAHEDATRYVERIQNLRGFLYYGHSVDRIRGVVATIAGNWEQAEQAFEEGLALCRRTQNEPEEATILYEQARMILIRTGTGIPSFTQHVQKLCEQARTIFSAYGMSRSVSLVDTLQEGIIELERRNRIAPEEKRTSTGYLLEITLTKREQEVLRLVAEGHTDREVAETLVISPRTVNRHLSNIFVKLDVPGRAAAVAYAIRQGVV